MQSSSTINPITVSDIPAITFLQNQCFEQKWTEKEICALLEMPTILGYCLKNESQEVIGYILCQWVIDEGEIISIAIHPGFMYQGLGSFLLKKTESTLNQHKIKYLYLEVSVLNAPAKAFYHKHGYRVEAVRPLYYHHFDGSRVDALVLKKRLFGFF